MPLVRPLLDRLLQFVAPYFVREHSVGTVRPPLFASPNPTATAGLSTSANRRRRRSTIRERCARYLASNQVWRRVDSFGRIVRVGQNGASNRPSPDRHVASLDTCRKPLPPPQPRGPGPVQVSQAPPTQPALPTIRIRALIVRGREIICETHRQWWRARDNSTRLEDQLEALEHQTAGQEGLRDDDDADFIDLRQRVRQEMREENFAARTGVALSATGSVAASQLERMRTKLFAEFESDDEEGTGTDQPATAAPPTELSSRAASDAALDARMRAEIPIIARAFRAVWQHRDTYLARRLEHEAGRNPNLPGWTADWPRHIFDREHLREGMHLTRCARDLHEVWVADLAIARDRGLGPFMDEQHIMFPEFNGGYTGSEVQGIIATAPRGRIMEWCKDLLGEQGNPYRAVPQKKEDYQYGLDDALDPEPGESASLCDNGGDRLDNVAARNRGGPFPKWSRNGETRHIFGFY
ncbi:hypothetical protein LTR95_001201 [Oleoguttula sp. CCFEE 5521]